MNIIVMLLAAGSVVLDAGQEERLEQCAGGEQPQDQRPLCAAALDALEGVIQSNLIDLIDSPPEPEADSVDPRVTALQAHLKTYEQVATKQSFKDREDAAVVLARIARLCQPDAIAPAVPGREMRQQVLQYLCDYEVEMGKERTDAESSEAGSARARLLEAADTLYKRNDWLKEQVSLDRYLDLTDDESIAAYAGEIKANREVLERITAATGYNIDIGDPYVPFSELDLLHVDYTVGVNFLSVNDAFEKGYPVVGMNIYRRYAPHEVFDNKWTSWFKGAHLSGSMRLNGIGEQIAKEEDDDANGNGLEDYADQAFDLDLSVFFPLIETDFNKGNDYFGLIIATGGRKVDAEPRFRTRDYAGVRFIYNSQFYFDALVGHSEPLSNRRLELRGQIPVYRGGRDSFVYAGATLNVGIKDRFEDQPDSINFYILFQSDAETLFNLN